MNNKLLYTIIDILLLKIIIDIDNNNMYEMLLKC